MVRILPVHRVSPDQAALGEVIQILRTGGVIAFPTDTVYGIGADALSEEPVNRIYCIKGRERKKPLVLFVSSKAELKAYVKRLPKTAERLVDSFLPGALTLIVRASAKAPAHLISQGTIGVRIPDHRVVLALLELYGGPLATTSANAAQGEPALSASEVASSLGEQVDVILDGGRSGSRLASAILDVSSYPPRLLRKGRIPLLSLERAMGRKVVLGEGLTLNVLLVCTGNLCRSPLAETLLEKLMPERLSGRVKVGSAGTAALPGSPAASFAIEVGLERGMDLSSHRSRQVDAQLLRDADLVLVMEAYQRERLLELLPEAGDKIGLLKGIGRRGPKREEELTVEDPAGGSKESYQRCVQELENSLPPLVRWLTDRVG